MTYALILYVTIRQHYADDNKDTVLSVHTLPTMLSHLQYATDLIMVCLMFIVGYVAITCCICYWHGYIICLLYTVGKILVVCLLDVITSPWMLHINFEIQVSSFKFECQHCHSLPLLKDNIVMRRTFKLWRKMHTIIIGMFSMKLNLRRVDWYFIHQSFF